MTGQPGHDLTELVRGECHLMTEPGVWADRFFMEPAHFDIKILFDQITKRPGLFAGRCVELDMRVVADHHHRCSLLRPLAHPPAASPHAAASRVAQSGAVS